MHMQIKEFADYTGVSVRTLHYYDEIGLLRPAAVDPRNGYRFYNEASLLRMQEILFYRELDFPLQRICELLSDPDYDRAQALQGQKQLLILKKNRLERLILAIDEAMKGNDIMNAFDNRELKAKQQQYEAEVREKWGNSTAYTEYTQKRKAHTDEQQQTLQDGLDAIFGEFARCMEAGNAPESTPAQALVHKLQAYITEHYYTCTTAILAGLGQMYVADERFTKNIDRHAAGTAAYAAGAIRIYCK